MRACVCDCEYVFVCGGGGVCVSFQAATSVFGMTINTTKTNCLSVGYGVCLKDLVSINSLPGTAKCVELFLYVGGLVAPAAHSTLDVAHSAAVVSGVFYALKNVVFNSADLTLNTQHHIYIYIYIYMYIYMYTVLARL